ncbi:hypothetical protein GGH96_001635 [Coemansia sp. RSA 1972]|nr:hypothetical protein GGH96_001635 [Coemansia sp. RSA 1972]
MGLGGVILVCMGLLRRRGRGYHSEMFGVFTGCSVLGTGLVLVLSSTVFAGIRRTTGLTFCNAWPLISHSTSTRWLRWYDSRLADLTSRADRHVQSIISRHSSSITDPNVRRVWERQLRDDAHRKLERIRNRREYCVRLVEQTGGGRKPRRGLEVYLQVGEWVMDKMIEWMRSSKVFVEEPKNGPEDEPDVSDMFTLLGGEEPVLAGPRALLAEPSAPELSTSQIMDLESFASTSRMHLDSNPPPYSPIDQTAKLELDTNLLL